MVELLLILIAFIVVVALVAACVVAVEVRTPRQVPWTEVEHDGRTLDMANGLVLQHDDGRTVWASRGYSIYSSFKGADFERVARPNPVDQSLAARPRNDRHPGACRAAGGRLRARPGE